MKLIDTHCHLNFNAFKGDFLSVVKMARDLGIDKIIIPGSNIDNSISAVKMAKDLNEKFGANFAAAGIGIHPVHADELEKFSEIERLAPDAVAIGECGFDFYHDKEKKTKNEQEKLFRRHIDLALKFNLPLICHNREADEEILEVLESFKKLPKIVFHCFSSDWKFAEVILDKGFYLSFTGNITYGNKTLKKVIERAPLEKILIETDAPYIVPEPLRSQGIHPVRENNDTELVSSTHPQENAESFSNGVKRNEPAHVLEVAKKIAEIKCLNLEKVAEATTQNAKEFFKLG